MSIIQAVLSIATSDMLPSDFPGVHDLAFIVVSLDTSPALEVNAFILSTSALVSVNGLAQA